MKTNEFCKHAIYCVKSGHVSTLRDFALECLRIREYMLSDDYPVVRKEQSKEHWLSERQKEYEKLCKMTKKAISKATAKSNEIHIDSYNRTLEHLGIERKRCVSMRDKILKWNAPSEFIELRSFMLQMVYQELCHIDLTMLHIEKPREITDEEWFLLRKTNLEHHIEILRDEAKQQNEKISQTRGYLKSAMNALPVW